MKPVLINHVTFVQSQKYEGHELFAYLLNCLENHDLTLLRLSVYDIYCGTELNTKHRNLYS